MCGGNTCRSVMAEVMMHDEMAKKLSQEGGLDLERLGFKFDSTGIRKSAARHLLITKNTIQVLNELGYEPPLKHRSKIISRELIEQADRIFAVTNWHLEQVLALVPEAKVKSSLLDEEKDIADPIGKEMAIYRETAWQVQAAIKRLVSSARLSV